MKHKLTNVGRIILEKQTCGKTFESARNRNPEKTCYDFPVFHRKDRVYKQSAKYDAFVDLGYQYYVIQVQKKKQPLL